MKIAEPSYAHTYICTKSCLGNCFHVGSMVERRTESNLLKDICLPRMGARKMTIITQILKQF